MFQYQWPFEKVLALVTQPSGRKVRTWVPAHSPEQYATLEADLQAALGEHFVSFEIEDQPGQELTIVTYTGVLVEDVEVDQGAQVCDPVYTAWMAANP
jgi:hypothetical protein